ncbi:hypothetical protein ACE1TF_05835 [Geomicrobium sp. JSM 1781026]|uniref:hypothetical protein n=1 Tax=Geomicrobium sp. JSM 1781026 TaxID=3344580 RepID=UPI0035C08FC0
MPKTISFNGGELSAGQDTVIWKIESKKVHCAVLNDLSYLKEKDEKVVPLRQVEHEGQSLVFTWDVRSHQVLSQVKKEPLIHRIKVAKALTRLVDQMESMQEYDFVMDPKNFYIDEFHNVKVLLYCKSIHIQCREEEQRNTLEMLKRTILSLFTTVPEKEVLSASFEDTLAKCDDSLAIFLKQVVRTSNYHDLYQCLDYELMRIEELYFESFQKGNEHQKLKTKKKKKIGLLTTSVLVVVGAGLLFIINNYSGAETVSEEDPVYEALDDAHQSIDDFEDYMHVIDLYFDSNYEEAHDELEQLDASLVHEPLWIEVKIRSGHAEELVNQDEYRSDTLELMATYELEDDILELSSENLTVQFEQSVINREDEEVINIATELTEWTDRRVQRAFQSHLREDEEEALAFAVEMEAENFQIVALEHIIDNLEEQLDAAEDDEVEEIEGELESYQEQLNELED